MLEKLKSFLGNDSIFYPVLLVLVAGISFGLGRQSVLLPNNETNSEKQGKIEVLAPIPQLPAAVASSTPKRAVEPSVSGAVAVVGSKSGTKYHLPDCSGAKRIKPENLITFDSVAKAEAAGYTAAANCPGLK